VGGGSAREAEAAADCLQIAGVRRVRAPQVVLSRHDGRTHLGAPLALDLAGCQLKGGVVRGAHHAAVLDLP
jgi:hypothetical protein